MEKKGHMKTLKHANQVVTEIATRVFTGARGFVTKGLRLAFHQACSFFSHGGPFVSGLVATCLTLTVAVPQQAKATQEFALALEDTPVFNSAEAARGHVKPDRCGQVRTLEFIAPAGTPFAIISTVPDTILQVTTQAYQAPSDVKLYVSAKGLLQAKEPFPVTARRLPSREAMLAHLDSAVGLPYVWGGNVRKGVVGHTGQRLFVGLDCSGLLYEVSQGATPRNTSQLVYFGEPVAVHGLSPEAIAQKLRPLDLIVWPGHVVVVTQNGQTIESILVCGEKQKSGVIRRPLLQRLKEIHRTRTPQDYWQHGAQYVVRRWVEP